MKRLHLFLVLLLTAIVVMGQNSSSANYLKILPSNDQYIYWQRNNELKYASLRGTVEKINGKVFYTLWPDKNFHHDGQIFDDLSIYMYSHISNNYIVLQRYRREYHSVFMGTDWVRYFPLNEYIKVSVDGKRIIDTKGVEYNKVITKADVLAIERKRDGGAGVQYYGGSGSSSNSSGGSYHSTTTDSRCKTCGGSGACTSCGGRKGSWQSTGYYVGDDSKSWIPCSSCNGSGHCFMCRGTGRF